MKVSQTKRNLITRRITNHRGLCDGQSALWLFKMSFTTKLIILCSSPFDGAIRSGTTLWTTLKRCIRILRFPTLCTTSLVRKWRKTRRIHLILMKDSTLLLKQRWNLMVSKKNEKERECRRSRSWDIFPRSVQLEWVSLQVSLNPSDHQIPVTCSDVL